MKKGNTVTIYHDPLTEDEEEGQAKLLKPIFNTNSGEYWQVKFLGRGDENPMVMPSGQKGRVWLNIGKNL